MILAALCEVNAGRPGWVLRGEVFVMLYHGHPAAVPGSPATGE